MTEFTIDWGTTSAGSTTAADGPDTLVDAYGNEFDINVSTPSGGSGSGEEWTLDVNSAFGDIDGTTNELVASSVNDPVTASITFDSGPVSNVSFELYDVDAGSWDDSVTIYAQIGTGAGAVLVPVTFADQSVHHSVTPVATPIGSGYRLDADGNDNPGVEGSGATDTVTVNIAGPITSLVIVYDNGESASTSGVVGIGPITFTDPTAVPCFVRGTMIDTNRGEVAIEDLLAGDMVRTLDNGMQALRWIGATTVKGKGSKAPVLFRKGTIGNSQDLLLSPEHRVMLHGWRAEVLFGKSELLASAKTLINDHTIVRQESDEVEYFHILFDAHEIVFSNGAPTESFHPGEASIGSMAEETRQEILDLFPELALNADSYGPAVRKTLQAHEAALLNI